MGCATSSDAAGDTNNHSRAIQVGSPTGGYCASGSASHHALLSSAELGPLGELELDPLHRGYDHAQLRTTDPVAIQAFCACIDTSARSVGHIVPEPKPRDIELRLSYRVSAAHMHGITADPCQFNPGRETTAILEAAGRATRAWMPDEHALEIAENVRQYGTVTDCSPGHRRGSANGSAAASMFDISLGVQSFASPGESSLALTPGTDPSQLPDAFPAPPAPRLTPLALAKHTRLADRRRVPATEAPTTHGE